MSTKITPKLKSTTGTRGRIARSRFQIRRSLCERKSRNIITDIRTKLNFSNTAIDSSCFRSASSFAPSLRKRGRSYFLVLGFYRPAGFFRTKSSFESSRALFRRIEFRRTANIRRRAEYLGPPLSSLSFIPALTCASGFYFTF